MSRFDQDPDFTLEWPPELFETELRRLVVRCRQLGIDGDWRNEVETLLRQAFSSGAPCKQFENILDGLTQRVYQGGYGFDEEPF